MNPRKKVSKNIKVAAPLPVGLQKRMLDETYDLDRDAERALDELADSVKTGRCSLGFALARAFGNGAAYVEQKRQNAAKRASLGPSP